MIKIKAIAIILLLCLACRSFAGLSGCDDLTATPQTPYVDFELEIQPIFSEHCIQCHSQPSPSAFMDLSLGYTDIVDVDSFEVPFFKRVAPGDVTASYLFFKINCSNQFSGDRMPREAPPLSLTEQAMIRDWINQLLIFSDGFE